MTSAVRVRACVRACVLCVSVCMHASDVSCVVCARICVLQNLQCDQQPRFNLSCELEYLIIAADSAHETNGYTGIVWRGCS